MCWAAAANLRCFCPSLKASLLPRLVDMIDKLITNALTFMLWGGATLRQTYKVNNTFKHRNGRSTMLTWDILGFFHLSFCVVQQHCNFASFDDVPILQATIHAPRLRLSWRPRPLCLHTHSCCCCLRHSCPTMPRVLCCGPLLHMSGGLTPSAAGVITPAIMMCWRRTRQQRRGGVLAS